jgi:hypothetical protein
VENIEFDNPVMIDDFTLIYARAGMRIESHVHIACDVQAPSLATDGPPSGHP